MLQNHHSQNRADTGTALETSGTLIRLRMNSDLDKQESTRQHSGGLKKKITGFTAKSRLGFARAMASTDWPVEPSHVTLTYGQVTPKMMGTYFKEDLRQLRKWCARHGVVGFWRLEFQERKQACIEFLSRSSCISKQQLSLLSRHGRTAHFHCLVLNLTETLEAKLRKWWIRRIADSLKLSAQAMGYSDIPGTWHFPVKVTYREAGKASWYLALHGQKDTQAPNISVGRWWGYFGKEEMVKLQTWTHYGTLSESVEFRFRRIVRRLLRRKTNGRARNSITVFMTQKTQRKLLLYLYRQELGEQVVKSNETSFQVFASKVFNDELEPF